MSPDLKPLYEKAIKERDDLAARVSDLEKENEHLKAQLADRVKLNDAGLLQLVDANDKNARLDARVADLENIINGIPHQMKKDPNTIEQLDDENRKLKSMFDRISTILTHRYPYVEKLVNDIKNDMRAILNDAKRG